MCAINDRPVKERRILHEERLMLVTILHAAWSRVILMRQGEGVGQEEGHIYIVG